MSYLWCVYSYCMLYVHELVAYHILQPVHVMPWHLGPDLVIILFCTIPYNSFYVNEIAILVKEKDDIEILEMLYL